MSSPAAPSQPVYLPNVCVPNVLKPQDFELRQIAGLTSGETIILTQGRHDFGTDRSGNAGFSLEIGSDGSITIVPGPNGIHLDSNLVYDRHKLGSEVINAGSARFQIGVTRPSGRSRKDLVGGSTPQIHELTVKVLEIDQEYGTQEHTGTDNAELRNSRGPSTNTGITRFLANRSASPTGLRAFPTPPSVLRHDTPTAATHSTTSRPGSQSNPTGFVDRLLAARSHLAEQRRHQHPNPEELARRAKHGKTLTWRRDSDHWHFGLVGLATADLPWQPHFDDPTLLTDYHRDLVRSVGSLPSVPVVADLRAGPIGIVGSRAARLACTRHILTALATLSSPQDLHLSVRTTEDRYDDWAWAAHLPHVTSSIDRSRSLVVIDDERQFDNSASGLTVAASAGVGTILLADNLSSLPPQCATVMVLHESGLATIKNHRDGNTVTGATPHGISTRLASESAANLASQDSSLSLVGAVG